MTWTHGCHFLLSFLTPSIPPLNLLTTSVLLLLIFSMSLSSKAKDSESSICWRHELSSNLLPRLQYLFFDLFHPLGNKESIDVGEAKRLLRNCSNHSTLSEDIQNLKNHLKNPGYDLNFIDKCLNTVLFINRPKAIGGNTHRPLERTIFSKPSFSLVSSNIDRSFQNMRTYWIRH